MILSAQEFVRLRASENPDEYARAVNEEADEKTWMDIINVYPDMKVWVVRNKTVPLRILHFLADDLDPNVRAAIADKRKLDQALFEKLAHDVDESVRQRLAYNKKAPLDVLMLLSNDSEEIVREVARKRLAAKWTFCTKKVTDLFSLELWPKKRM